MLWVVSLTRTRLLRLDYTFHDYTQIQGECGEIFSDSQP